ncbi:hypothetical protein HDU79_008905 [Rhizoclosmatium sp. JEL0117]|nr:hypothetical protein HDU79_008905 [Rhizoclosmatium sp. JEL0117]
MYQPTSPKLATTSSASSSMATLAEFEADLAPETEEKVREDTDKKVEQVPANANANSNVVNGDGIRPQSEAATTTQPPTFKSFSEILLYSLVGGAKSWATSFGLRGGVFFLVSLLKVAKKKASLSSTLKELFMSRTVYRFANMVGCFAAVFKLVSNYLRFKGLFSDQRLCAFAGGFVGGFSVLFETYENRVVVLQQFGIRGLQAIYNGLEARNLFSFTHGDSLLFSIACGSIMYAYVMQPDTIPPEYLNWIVKTARVPRESLALNRQNHRASESSSIPPITLAAMTSCIQKYAPTNTVNETIQSATEYYTKNVSSQGILPIVPCEAIHPSNTSCQSYNLALFPKIFRSIAPVYAALNFVPMLLLRPRKFLNTPLDSVTRGVWNTIVSSTFLSSYVGIYMTGICLVRNLVRQRILQKDYKIFYYLLGCLASGLSILIEKKGRRAELAMYVLPKGLQSLFLVCQRRKWVCHIPGSETALCCLSMAVLMGMYQNEPANVSPLVVKVFDKVIGRY